MIPDLPHALDLGGLILAGVTLVPHQVHTMRHRQTPANIRGRRLRDGREEQKLRTSVHADMMLRSIEVEMGGDKEENGEKREE